MDALVWFPNRMSGLRAGCSRGRPSFSAAGWRQRRGRKVADHTAPDADGPLSSFLSCVDVLSVDGFEGGCEVSSYLDAGEVLVACVSFVDSV